MIRVERIVNGQRVVRDRIGIGASAGGVRALLQLTERLPGDLQASVFVVLHRSPTFVSRFADLLAKNCALSVVETESPETIRPGRIYIAARDRHLLVDGDVVRPDGGPREHFARPAVDPLFRSLAHSAGARAVGVVLTGSGSDGYGGLLHIKAAGGLTLAQDPAEAPFDSMPRHAILFDHVDAVLPLDQIAEVIAGIASGSEVTVTQKA